MSIVFKSRSLNLLEPSGPVQARIGIALPFLRLTKIQQFESFRFFLGGGWMKSEVYKRRLDTPDQLLAPILDAAACIQKSEDQLRRTRRNFRTRFAKWTEVGSGFLNYNLNCYRFVISVLKVCLLYFKLKLKLN